MPYSPWLMSLRVSAPSSPIAYVAPPLLQERIPGTTPYGGYCTSAAAARNCCDHCNWRYEEPQLKPPQPTNALSDSAVRQVARAIASLNTSAVAATRESFCNRFALRSADVQRRDTHEYLLRPAEGGVICESNAPLLNSAEYATSRDQKFSLKVHRPRQLAFALLTSAQCSNKFQEPRALRTVAQWTQCDLRRKSSCWQRVHHHRVMSCCLPARALARPRCCLSGNTYTRRWLRKAALRLRTCSVMRAGAAEWPEFKLNPHRWWLRARRESQSWARRLSQSWKRRMSLPLRRTPSRSPHTYILICYSRPVLTKQPYAALYSYIVLVVLFFLRMHFMHIARPIVAGQLILRIFVLLCLHFALPVRSRSAARRDLFIPNYQLLSIGRRTVHHLFCVIPLSSNCISHCLCDLAQPIARRIALIVKSQRQFALPVRHRTATQ